MAWEPLGWTPVFFSEIEPFPSAVLAHHWPDVPNKGDMTQFEEWEYESGDIDVLVGGTPCQSFSIAGMRGGLGDSRGNLSLTYMRMVDRLRPRWTVWENVPGVLSSNGGRDFGSIVGALAELGYSCAWRVLDAQNFGVPQRRRRVFLVGCASGHWRDPASVLFESNCGGRDFEASRKTQAKITGSTAKCFAGNKESTLAAKVQTTMHDYSLADSFNTVLHSSRVAPTCTASGPPYSRMGQASEVDALVVHGTQDPIVSDKAMPLGRNQGQENVVVIQDQATRTGLDSDNKKRQGLGIQETQTMYTLTSADRHGVCYKSEVRRLTPVEAERLQGFPDGHTDIGWNGKPTPDSHRYKAMGNSMAVPVMRWIGERIEQVSR